MKLCNYVDVYKNDFITNTINFMSATATSEEIKRFKIQIDDVIITKDSEDWLDIGVPSLVKYEDKNLICGYHLAILRPNGMIGGFLHRALFLSIHPYQDGNGRLSRLLTNLLLIKLDYKFVLYVSFEHIIEQKKAAYYQALMEGQRNRYAAEERIDNWALFFLDSLSELILKLEQKLKEYRNLGGYMNQRQKDILNYIQINQPIKLGDLTKDLPQYSAATIKKDLQYLVNEFEIERLGNNRGTVYKIKAK